MGNVPQLKISTDTEETTHTESHTGEQLEDFSLFTQKKCSVMFTLEEFNRDNLALALQGTKTNIGLATVTAEAHQANIGRSFVLDRANILSFTSLTGVGGSPTYVEGTDYTVNLASGVVTIPATGSAIANNANVLANYSAGNSYKVSTFTAPRIPYWLFFEGLNTADTKKPVLIDLFKVNLKPQKEWELIQNDNKISSLDLEGKVLYDALQPDNTADGRFMRTRFISG